MLSREVESRKALGQISTKVKSDTLEINELPSRNHIDGEKKAAKEKTIRNILI